MPIVEFGDLAPTYELRKRLGLPNGLGNTICGRSLYGYRSEIDGVYYPVYRKGHQRIALRAYIVPPDPKTESQLARRAIFRDAMTAWQALTEEERKPYNKTARVRGKIYGVHIFLSEYLKSHS